MRPDTKTVKLPSVTTNGKTGTSERPTTDRCTGEAGNRATSIISQRHGWSARESANRALQEPLKERPLFSMHVAPRTSV
jgi:hypothetical protein